MHQLGTFTEESVAVAGTRLALSELQKVYVEFTVNCPVNCVGTTIIVNLYYSRNQWHRSIECKRNIVKIQFLTIAITKNKKRNQNLLDFDCAYFNTYLQY